MKLARLIDLELRLAADAPRPAEALDARDAELGAALSEVEEDAELLEGWLDALDQKEGTPSTGHRVELGYVLLCFTVLLVGLSLGGGLSASLLTYTPPEPVNIAPFLWLVVAGQLGLLLLWPLLWLAARALPSIPDAWYAPLRWGWSRLQGEVRARVEAAGYRLRSRRSLYRQVERGLLISAAQLLPIAFNIAVLLGLLRLIAVEDLALAWRSSSDFVVDNLHRWVSALSLPWRELWPEAVPSAAEIAATRRVRLDGPPGTLPGRGWLAWKEFLIAATLVWGLLPRALLAVGAALYTRRALAHVPLDTPEVTRVLRRLRRARTRIAALDHAEAPAISSDQSTGDHRPGEGPIHALLWRDVPVAPARLQTLTEAKLGAPLASCGEVGSRDFDQSDALASLDATQDGTVLLVAEKYEDPDAAALRCLRALRERLGPRYPLLVGIVSPDDAAQSGVPETTVALWRERLAALEDPYLSVEALQAP